MPGRKEGEGRKRGRERGRERGRGEEERKIGGERRARNGERILTCQY
jgi:hypothetical protein